MDLTQGNIAKTLFKLTLPMTIGMLALVAFHLSDTWFVSKLGTNELTALSFTFPIVMIFSSIALGFSTGTSSVISKFIGRGDIEKVQRLTTDTFLLSLLLVCFFGLIGYVFIDETFIFLGAPADILPLIKDYMQIWYFGIIFLVIPIIGNGAIRASGDTIFPGSLMSAASVINFLMDPLLIFGMFIFPAMGIKGAALATVIARGITFFVSIYMLINKYQMINLKRVSLRKIIISWKEILYISIPVTMTNLLNPLSQMIIIKLLATHGKAAVAGVGVSSKMESFGLLIPMAFSSVLGPFTGQNLGAKKISRIRKAIRLGYIFSFSWGILLLCLYFPLSKEIAFLFTSDSSVVKTITSYFLIVPMSYSFMIIFYLTNSILNAMGKPLHSAILQLGRLFVLYIPLAYLGSYLYKINGIFSALAVTNIISSIFSIIVLSLTIRKMSS